EALPAVHQKALSQVREDRQEDAVLQAFTQAPGVLSAAPENDIEPARWDFGIRSEGFGTEKQPPVPEGLVRVSVARRRKRLDKIDLVEVRGSRVRLATIESPQPPVRYNDPVGYRLVQCRHDARTRVFF